MGKEVMQGAMSPDSANVAPLGHDLQARQPVTRAMAVPNIVGAPVEYQVFCDMDVVSGPEKIKCPSSQAVSYKVRADS